MSASDTRHRLVYTARLPEPIERELHERYDAIRIERAYLARLDAGIEALVVMPSTPLRATAIQSLPASIRIIASYSVGTDHIDLAAAAARGLPVTNTPDVLTDATADVAMLLILSACRQASSAERELRAGRHDQCFDAGVQPGQVRALDACRIIALVQQALDRLRQARGIGDAMACCGRAQVRVTPRPERPSR